MSPLLGLFFALLLLLSHPAHATSLELCRAILTQKQAGSAALEQATLLELKADDIVSEQITELSGFVFKLPARNGKTYVLRLSSELGEPGFESFAAAFINHAPGGLTPSVRTLSRAELEPFLEVLNATGRKIMARDAEPAASLAVYYPAQIGHEFLSAANGAAFAEALSNFLRVAKSLPTALDLYREPLMQAAASTSPLIRDRILSELKVYFPELARVPAGALFEHVLNNARKLAAKPVAYEGLRVSSWKRLPREIRAQLANQWVLCAALGIPDFHSRNWLYFEGSIIAIDASLPSDVFLIGSKKLGEDSPQWVLDGGPVNEALIGLIVKDASPELLRHLRSLDVGQIKRLDPRRALTTAQARGIILRIAALNKYR